MKIEEAVQKYVEYLNSDGEFSEKEVQSMKDTLKTAMKMTTALPFEVNANTFAKSILLLALFALSNGNSKAGTMVACLKFKRDLEFFAKEDFNPLAECLNIFYGEEPNNQ